MKLTCDLCGSVLTDTASGAVCSHCGLEYGPDRLQEKRTAQQSAKPEQEKPAAKTKKSSNSGGVLFILAALAILSALSGVFVTAIIFGIIFLIVLMFRKK